MISSFTSLRQVTTLLFLVIACFGYSGGIAAGVPEMLRLFDRSEESFADRYPFVARPNARLSTSAPAALMVELLTNPSFDDTGGATFGTTFEGSPAEALPRSSSVIPGWFMDYSCSSAPAPCPDGYWIDDTADNLNNPDGDHFIWLAGGFYCARQSGFDWLAGETYRIGFAAASWSEPAPQEMAEMILEVDPPGANNTTTVFTLPLGPSPSWENLNWQSRTFDYTVPADGSYTLLFSQQSNTNNPTVPKKGITLDQLSVVRLEACTDPILSAPELEDGGVCALSATPLAATAFFEETELEDGTFTFNLFEADGMTSIQMGATEIDPTGRAEQSSIVVEVVYTPADPALVCPATERFTVTFDNSFCGCDLSINDVVPVCTYIPENRQSTYLISVAATADPVLSGEDVSFEFNGTVRGTTTVQPNGNITFTNVSIPEGPALDYTARLFLVDNPECDSERSIDLVACSGRCEDAIPGPGENLVGGRVYIDDDLDGTLDGGETGPGLVRVRVYDCNDNLVAQDLTDETGNWFVRPLEAGQQYRVEFDTPRNPELESSLSGPDNGSNVQFITVQPGRNCNNNYGLTDPSLYCQDNPLVLMPCYYVGPQDNIAGRPTLVATYYNEPGGTSPDIEMLLTADQIGTTWGLAFQNAEQKLYMATVVRNFMGYGPEGFDAIYVSDLTDPDGDGGASPSLSAPTHFNVETDLGTPVDLGTDPRAAGQPQAIPGTNIKYRDDAWRGVGQAGIGDIDISSDGDTLFVVNLNEARPSLLLIDVSNPSTPSLIDDVAITNPGCTSGGFAPWATKYYRGKIYVGVVCTADGGGSAANLSATVYRYDGGTTFTTVASAPLDYQRSAATYRDNGTFASAAWQPWSDTFDPEQLPLRGRDLVSQPMPMLTDIEFGDDGSLYVGLGDRFTFMTAFRQQAWGTTQDGTAYTPVAAGDLLRFCQQGSSDTYVVEGTSGCPQPITDAASQSLNQVPVFNEYFQDDFVRIPDAGHAESVLGAMAKIPGRRELVVTTFDPIVNGGPVNTSGTRYYSEDGTYTKGLVIVGSSDFRNNAKGGSLGDLELACDAGPIELGNYVWFDLDGDGAQDPCEPPVAGVMMKLFLKSATDGAIPLATTTTDASGNYSFIGDGQDNATWSGPGAGGRVSSTEQYFIAACGDSFTPGDSTLVVNGTTYSLTIQNTGARNDADLSDSDFFVLDINGTDLPAYCTVGDDVRGSNNSLDLGLRPPPCELDFENLTVNCTNDNEFTVTFDLDYDYDNAMAPGEQLFIEVNGEEVGASPYTLTQNSGTISGLSYTTTTPQFGVDVRTFFAINRDCEISRVIDLIACPAECVGPGQIGGNVYLDNNNDGVNDATEFGLGNVSVKVYSCEDGDDPVCETFTNTNGGWSCPNITDGREYRVEYSRPLRPNLEEAFAGPDNLTGVQFVTGGTCASSYGLLDPATYCNQEMLSLAVSCYESGSLEGGTNGGNPAFVSMSADASGATPPPSTDLTLAQIGSVWGTAHVPQTSTVYAGAVLKRHTAVVDGLGFLYELDYTDINAPSLVQGLNLEGVVPQNRSTRPLEFGTVCRGGACVDGPGNTGFQDDYVLPDNPTDLSRDLDAFAKIGKVGFGDVDYDPASGLLWMVNLNERTLLSMDVTAANPLTTINAYEINDAFGIPACPGGEPRPWGLHFRNGLGYLGLVCDAAGTQSLDDLESFIMQFDPADPDNSFTTLVRIPIQEPSHVDRIGNDDYQEADYLPWFNTYSDLPAQLRDSLAANDNFNGVQTLRVGQPIISDIDFTPAGDLIVSIMDRTAMQFGYLQTTPQSRSEILVNPISYGDLIWLCPRGDGGYRKEASPGSCDPSTTGSPFYPQFGDADRVRDDYFDLAAGDGSYDGALGSHTVLNDGQVVYTTYDPFPPGEDVFSPGGNEPYINTQGLHYNSLDNGSRLDWYRIVGQGFERQEYGQGIGLGDVIALCDVPQIQLGNYAWIDENEDGIQDPCEPAIEDLTVKLFRVPDGGGTPVQIATTMTDSIGSYYFSSASSDDEDLTWTGTGADTAVLAGANYYIAFCGDNGYDAARNELMIGQRVFTVTRANESIAGDENPDDIDSDITIQTVGDAGQLPAYLTVAGEKNSTTHIFDAGFIERICELEISAVTYECAPTTNADGTTDYTFLAGTSVTATDPPAGDLEVLFNGEVIRTLTPAGTTVPLTNLNLPGGPSFGNVLTVRFVVRPDCAASTLIDLIACTPDCDDQAGTDFVGGNVFRDLNNDGADAGADEGGQANVLVRVYDCEEMLICEVFTDENGNWSCDGAMAGDTFRVEYTTPLSPELEESVAGPDNGTSTQFVIGGMCDADYGVLNPDDFCVENPDVITACFVVGDPNATDDPSDVLVLYPQNRSGVDVSAADYVGPTTIMTKQEVGSIWGLASSRFRQGVYASAFLKRHSGLAETDPVTGAPLDNPLGAIFFNDLQGGATELFIDLGAAGIDVGTIADNATRGVDVAPDEPSADPLAYPLIGKVGIGNIALSEDGNTLYAINLFEKSIVSIAINADGSPGAVTSTPIADPGCNGGTFRPFCINPVNGTILIGVVCDAGTSEMSQDLSATVYQWDGASDFTTVINFPLDYEKGYTVAGSCEVNTGWFGWADDYQDPCRVQDNGRRLFSYPQPLLSDIDVDVNGDLVLAFMDRFGHQMGYDNMDLEGNLAPDRIGSVGGDILRVARTDNGSYVLENNATAGDLTTAGADNGQGPGGGEFYFNDFAPRPAGGDGHQETGLGSVTINPRTGVMTSTVIRPGANEFSSSAGTTNFNSMTGEIVSGYSLYRGDNPGGGPFSPGVYGKGGGLGETILFCGNPQIQIGNYAWLDQDADGLQDPCEPPLAGLTVKLYRKNTDGVTDPVLIATDVTDATGNYYFSSASAAAGDAMQTWIGTGVDTSLVRDSLYFIAFCGDNGYDAENNALIVGGVPLCPSPANVMRDSVNDQNDSDITEQAVGAEMLPAYCTTAADLADGTNHTFDAGFKPLPYDLALRKTIADGQAAGFQPGDQVIFDIEVINQSLGTAYNIIVGDSLGAGLTFVETTPTGGVLTSAGGTTLNLTEVAAGQTFNIDSLSGMDSVTFQVVVAIADIATSQSLRPLINYAEIQAFRDAEGNLLEDEDSTPDDNFSNDPGGAPGSEADDFTQGDGTGMAGDSTAVTDEDDADPARIPIFDLALRKTIDAGSLSPTGSYPPGTDITFNIDVINQGTDSVINVVIKDYVPCGLDANGPIQDGLNPGWTFNGGPTGTGTVNDSVFFTITMAIAPDSAVQVPIVLRRRFEAGTEAICGLMAGEMPPADFLTNVAEIRQFEDLRGNMPPDFDSTPDGDEDNDPGGMVNDVTDNIISGNGNDVAGSNDPATDEDDQDPANLDAFDLAIFKVLDTLANPGPFVFGDIVEFNISVISQGNIEATGVTIRDLLPPGLSYDPSYGDGTTNATIGWMVEDATAVTLEITDFTGLVNGAPAQATLGIFDTATVSIFLQVDPPTMGSPMENYTNLAELVSGTFDNPMTGDAVTVTADGDSPYSLGRGNDTGDGPDTDDDNQTLDDRPGEDIDSQDPAFIEVLLGVALGDTTFIDVNMDGLQDAGDVALPNVTVTVYDAETMMPVTTDVFGNDYNPVRTTDATGAYLFDSLVSGNYYVEFDITTAPNFELYDFTTANAGMNDTLDSDVMPTNPMDDVANSDTTGVIPPGDTLLTLDAGVVCAIMVEVAEPFTICATQDIDLTADASVSPASLGGNFTTDGSGMFLDAAGAEIATGPFALGTAVTYRPSAADARRGFVNITLTTNDPADLTPTSVCAPVSATVRVEVLKVDCGSFFWDGSAPAGGGGPVPPPAPALREEGSQERN